jgi:hypothetical protein
MVALYTVWYSHVTELAEMVDASLPKPGKRGPYSKVI